MVRLKGAIPRAMASARAAFQFQYGSIKSEEINTMETQRRRFNSNMVRLKVT